MNSNVMSQVCILSESFTAVGAFEWAFFGVCQDVFLQTRFVRQSFVALGEGTVVRDFMKTADVLLKRIASSESSAALFALVRLIE